MAAIWFEPLQVLHLSKFHRASILIPSIFSIQMPFYQQTRKPASSSVHPSVIVSKYTFSRLYTCFAVLALRGTSLWATESVSCDINSILNDIVFFSRHMFAIYKLNTLFSTPCSHFEPKIVFTRVYQSCFIHSYLGPPDISTECQIRFQFQSPKSATIIQFSWSSRKPSEEKENMFKWAISS